MARNADAAASPVRHAVYFTGCRPIESDVQQSRLHRVFHELPPLLRHPLLDIVSRAG
jgi:hypothetical protein